MFIMPVSNVWMYWRALMVDWLEQASQIHEMYCHGLEVMNSNPGWVELGVCNTSSHTWTKNIMIQRNDKLSKWQKSNMRWMTRDIWGLGLLVFSKCFRDAFLPIKINYHLQNVGIWDNVDYIYIDLISACHVWCQTSHADIKHPLLEMQTKSILA